MHLPLDWYLDCGGRNLMAEDQAHLCSDSWPTVILNNTWIVFSCICFDNGAVLYNKQYFKSTCESRWQKSYDSSILITATSKCSICVSPYTHMLTTLYSSTGNEGHYREYLEGSGIACQERKGKQANSKNYLAIIVTSHLETSWSPRICLTACIWLNPHWSIFLLNVHKYLNTFQFYISRVRTREILVSQKW